MPAFGLPDSTLHTVRDILAACPAVEKAVIYGSRAMGTQRPGSDIDLTLLGDGMDAQDLSDIAGRLEASDIPYMVDLSLLRLIDNPKLLDHIARVGQVFFTRSCESNTMSVPIAHQQQLITYLREQVPGIMAVYAFGSRIMGTAGADSDLDMAVLREGTLDPLQLLQLSGALSDIAGCPVDLLDLRAASTVMQYQILMRGERWWSADHRAGSYEATLLNLKTQLDEARAGLLADIIREGKVHG